MLELLNAAPRLTARQTTIMAVAYAGGVVLGADSRTSTGALLCQSLRRPTHDYSTPRKALEAHPQRRLLRRQPRGGQD